VLFGFLDREFLVSTVSSSRILFGAIMWFTSSDELEGRPYWIITLAGFAIFASIQGEPLSILSWSLVLILSGSVLFLYSSRGRKLTIIPLIAVIGISGLPYTPAAVGWQGIFIEGNFLRNVINILSVSFLILGYLQHANYPSELLTHKEKWIWLTYPIGLILLILTHWFVLIFSDLELWVPGILIVSIIAFLIPLLFYFLLTRYMRASYYSEYFQDVLRPFGKIFIQMVSLQWLYRIIWSLLNSLQKIARA